MPFVTRLGDRCTGHDCHPPRGSIQASDDVTANGIGIHRQADLWGAHACPGGPPHSSILGQGMTSVTVNGRPIARVGDPIVCGSFVATGSPNVTAGG